MHIEKKNNSPTSLTMTIAGEPKELATIKERVLKKLAPRVKVAGFRPGKAPLSVVEKNLDQNTLMSEFLEEAVNELYVSALTAEKLRPAGMPQVQVKKYVPFTTVEFDVELDVIGPIKLANYRGVKVTKATVSVTAKDVQDVLDNLQLRMAEKNDVDRAAKDGDHVWIDFDGTDAKGQPIAGASGKDYPLALGSQTFIPGFEENLAGVKAGDEKEFTIPFPKDYGVKALQGKKVTFTVKVSKVQEVVKPKLDDALAAKVGPFQSVTELKADIKKQLTTERQREAEQAYDNELIRAIASKSTVDVPKSVVDDQIARMEEEERRNLTYRGQTWQEHLEQEGITEEEHRERQRPDATDRVKAGLILSEIADQEKLDVMPEEIQLRIDALKGQYSDPAMQAELDKPENQRNIASQILTEKTINRLRELNQK